VGEHGRAVENNRGEDERPSAASSPAAHSPPPSASFAEATRFWVKLGFISFGGPAGQIAIMHRELVERRRWVSEERFLHALNYCMLLPGPEATQLAIYIGWLLHRVWGGILAGLFFVLPSIFVLLALSLTYAVYGNVPTVTGALNGFKPVVVAIVVEAILKIGKRAIKREAHLLIAAIAFVSIYFLHVPFPLIVLAAGLTGMLLGEAGLGGSQSSAAAAVSTAPSVSEVSVARATVIDDDAPPPAHTLPSRRRVLRTLSLGLALWVLPLMAIVIWRGWDSLHAQEYRYFTQAALVTFGGAYAVLAYVTQAAAGSFGWMTKAQAVDGLALAETTPGPLIMVLQFVGFMAAWRNPQGLSPTLSAITGALITTYTTFLPCFIFIFVGAPYIEVLRGSRKLTAALSGITAAVVGVILNLALVFGAAVIWPDGLSAGTDWFAAILSVSAFIALYLLKADVLLVVISGGLVGLIRALLFR
jgi:chromate transporter